MEIKSDVSASQDTDLMLQMSCVQCRVVVWIGPVSSAPAGMSVAYPREFDWESVCDHFQPHCKICWAIEENKLDMLSNNHCAKGPLKKTSGKGGRKKNNVIKKPADKKKKPVGGKKGKKKPAASSKGKKKPAAASKGKKKPGATIEEKMTQEKMITIVKASHNRSIAAASAEASVLLTHDAKETKQQVETVVKENDKKQQLGGVQGCIQTALENAHVVPPPPRTPWEVIIYI